MAAPKIIPYDVELRSVNPVRSFDRPKAYTNDLNSVEFQFKVLDITSAELTTATAVTLVYMRDGSFFANPSTDVSRVGNVFSYLLKENEGNHAGVAQIQLVVTVDGMELASQLFDFEIINGLETKVAQEVMIYDWTTLTRDVRAYIDQFVADEVFRDAQFDNAQFDRNTAFVASQDARALAFGTEQTNRGTAFTAEQNERTTAFNESESGRTTAETGRVTAEDGRVIAENNRVTKEGQRVTAETNRVTAEGNRVTAESGRVTAENARVTAETNRAAAFTAFDTRLTAEETATANNKISAVKVKTFADVDARIEDLEADTTMMGTNLIANGDFTGSTAGWSANGGAAISTLNNELRLLASAKNAYGSQTLNTVIGNQYYVRETFKSSSNLVRFTVFSVIKYHTGSNNYETYSGVFTASQTTHSFATVDTRDSGWDYVYIDNAIAIDLTATFGKGNEPTAEQMDGIMAKFTNSWFNGTANLFRANATLNKLMAVDARTEFEAKNLVKNGDFTNGSPLTDFGTPNAMTVSDKLTVNGTATTYSGKYVDVASPTGNKLYVSYLITNAGATSPNLTISDYGTYNNQSWPSPTSGLKTSIISSKLNGIRFYIQQVTDVVYNNFTLDNLLVIDLTATFGAGKEPTLAEMDRLMARYPNSWFDGVKPVQTIETLYQEKANKVQEAWITPTLINGWASSSSYPTVGYFKDTLGIVHLRGVLINGTASTVPFVLPAGYRPIATMKFGCSTNGISFASHSIIASGEQYPSSANIDLSSVHFRAEA